MGKSKGWVIIDRTMQDNFLWTSDQPFDIRSAWIDLILLANHDDGQVITRRGVKVDVPRGSVFTSVRHLADRWHWSVGKVRRYTQMLISEKMLTEFGTPNGTLLSLVNYRKIQDRWRTNGTTDGTTDGITDGRRTKNIKNESKKGKNAPASLEEKFEAIRRNAMKGKEVENDKG